MRHTIFLLGLSLSVVLLLPAQVQAHLVDTRCGPFYDGLCHPFVSPTDLMIILALSLLAGYAGPSSGRTTLFSVTFTWLIGTVIGYTWLSSSFAIPVALAAGASLLLALLVMANQRCPQILLALLSVSIGLGFGLANGAEFGSLNGGSLALAGNVTCVFVVTTWATALAVKNHDGWRRIINRVAGSWLAAASLLTIGWELRSIYSN